jgi:hypothetical protein
MTDKIEGDNESLQATSEHLKEATGRGRPISAKHRATMTDQAALKDYSRCMNPGNTRMQDASHHKVSQSDVAHSVSAFQISRCSEALLQLRILVDIVLEAK